MKAFVKFFGSEKPRGDCELLALSKVPDKFRINEAPLFGTKWFDYRFAHPITATYYYAHCYAQAMKDFCAMTIDRGKAESVIAFQNPDIFLTRESTACVGARQALDGIGCRYEWAMHFVMKRFLERGWHVFPRPNQMYSEELILDVQDAWKVECYSALQIAKSPAFQIKAGQTYDKLGQVQKAYVDWITAQALERGTEQWRPLSRLLSEGVMTPSIAAHGFDFVQIQKAQRALGLSC